jgi:hypothetical protein
MTPKGAGNLVLDGIEVHIYGSAQTITNERKLSFNLVQDLILQLTL